jgi:hypothetical protein
MSQYPRKLPSLSCFVRCPLKSERPELQRPKKAESRKNAQEAYESNVTFTEWFARTSFASSGTMIYPSAEIILINTDDF